MKTIQFKTNINCSGCVAKVTDPLNKAAGLAQWNVDIAHPDKVLTVQGNDVKEEAIVAAVQQAGFVIRRTGSEGTVACY